MQFLGDTAILTGRSLRHVIRSLDTIITTAITPIALMLLFVYVLGGAINAGTNSYVTYLLPGILLITIASGIAYTAYRLFLDLQGGIFERFHSMPIARSAVLWAHVLTSLVANLVSLLVVVLVAPSWASSRWAPTSGSPLRGASGSLPSRTPSRWRSTGAGSARRRGGAQEGVEPAAECAASSHQASARVAWKVSHGEGSPTGTSASNHTWPG